MMILLIDNYDSFVYNLARYVSELGYECTVRRNDALTLDDIKLLSPSHIIISPGPCTPNEAGICLSIIREFHGVLPILGVCLGHQAIGQVFGGKVTQAIKPMHGKYSMIKHLGEGLFHQITSPLKVARYHSLIVKNLPDDIIIDACTEEGEVMALRHPSFPTYGVQFHPESVLTEKGHAILKNFLVLSRQMMG